MNEPNPLLQGIARALMNPIARDQAQSAVTLGQRVGDVLMAGPRAWGRMMDSGYRPTGQPDDPMRDQLAADAMDVAGSVTVGGMPFAKPGALGSAGGKAGIRAYHGSPHDFDRFDLSKIGTGEGAQAYGHGLYFAEAEGVAKDYRNKLTDRTNFILADGSKFDPYSTLEHVNVRASAGRGDLDAAIVKAQEIAASGSPVADRAQRDLAKLLEIQQSGGMKPNPGRMYEVRIDADPNDFLDWDKPLSQQSEKVRKAWDQFKAKRPEYNDPAKVGGQYKEPTGQQFHSAAFEHVPGMGQQARAMAADELKQYGIPGIKYLDAGSRSAGDGSRNYVLFRDDIISIVRKYGVAAAASMFGMDAVIQAQTAEALQQ